MLILSLLEAHWLDGPEPRHDQCAHGTVLLSVDGHTLVAPEDGEFTVSAAALNLLRTLDHDHTKDNPVSEGGQLIPCCGFNVWLVGERFPVFVVGCLDGIDLQVVHAAEGVRLTRQATECLVPSHAWRRAVVSFAEAVLAFYAGQPPRHPVEDADDCEAWQAFWNEYHERLQRHRAT